MMIALKHSPVDAVSKHRLPKLALQTVEGVFDRVEAGCRAQRGSAGGEERVCRFVLDNDAALISPLIDHLCRLLEQPGVCGEDQRVRIGIALREALINAMHHGNLEVSSTLREHSQDDYDRLVAERRIQRPYCHRRVYRTVKQRTD